MENRVEEQELAVAEGTGGTATAGTDYAALSSGTLTFAVGDTSETVTVSSTTGAGTGTITDDDGELPLSTDSAPTTLSMADVEAKEGEAAAFLPTLSPPPSQPMMVTCVTAPVTATEGKDYEHVTGLRLAIAAGRGSVRVTAPTVDDEIPEPDETFTLRIVPEWTVVASFGRTVASEAVNVIDERLADAQAAGSSVTLGGHGRLPPGGPGRRSSRRAPRGGNPTGWAVTRLPAGRRTPEEAARRPARRRCGVRSRCRSGRRRAKPVPMRPADGRCGAGWRGPASPAVPRAASRARGRYLLAHRSEGFRERGASMALRFDPGGDGAGPWIGLASRWGAPEGGVRSLWGSLPGGVGGGAAAVGSASTLGLEVGYRSTKPLDMGLTVGLEKESGASGSFGAILRSTIRW